LAKVPGLRLRPGADLSRFNTFRIGGPAEILVEVGTESALSTLLKEVGRQGAPLFLIGVGSNVLFPDRGLAGVVIRLVGEFRRVAFEETVVRAGGGVSLSQLARDCAARSLAGLEPLAGFPSTVGGAVRMNAGCYGTEIHELLLSVRVMDREGKPEILSVPDLDPGYRRTRLQETGQIVVEATFELARDDARRVSARIDEFNRRRWDSLPSGEPNAGSIFKNPPGGFAGRMIDECRLKGTRIGGAQISPKHGNVIVNTGGGRAQEVLELMVRARRAVARRFRVDLDPEVVLAGSLREEWVRRCADIAARAAQGEDSPGGENAVTELTAGGDRRTYS
jgi:UDP-N-acetylmuramate dehydrogenase